MLSAVLSYSVVSNSATVWTVACQAPLSMRFSRQEYPSGLPCPPPGDLPNLGTEPRSPTLQADSLPSEPPGKPLVRLAIIKKSTDNKCWRGCGENGTLLHCWWECKLGSCYGKLWNYLMMQQSHSSGIYPEMMKTNLKRYMQQSRGPRDFHTK